MREAERAALSAPTIFEGIAQSAERMLHMHHVEGANPSALTICSCGVVQTTRLPLMQEITGAKPVRDASFECRAKNAKCRMGAARRARYSIMHSPFRILHLFGSSLGRVVKREQQTPQIENL